MPAGFASVVNHAVSSFRPSRCITPPVWGDGFIGLSLSTSWCPRSWSDVSDDELVLFHPSLSGEDDPEFGCSARIQHAVLRHSRHSQVFHNERARHDEAILPCLEQMLNTSRDSSKNQETAPLAQAFVASVHSNINAAYVYCEHAYAHELFATGAWLGILGQGRRALMPEFIAEAFLEYSAHPGDHATAEIINDYAQRVCGVQFLIEHAKEVVKSGIPTLINPRVGAAVW